MGYGVRAGADAGLVVNYLLDGGCGGGKGVDCAGKQGDVRRMFLGFELPRSRKLVKNESRSHLGSVPSQHKIRRFISKGWIETGIANESYLEV